MTTIVYLPKGQSLESYLCSLESVVESLHQNCLDGELSDMLNGTNTASKLSKQESKTESLTMPQSSETLETLSVMDMPSSTQDGLTLSARGSRANHFPWQEKSREPKIQEMHGPQLLNASASYNPSSRSWKTCEDLSRADISEQSWEIWPKAGIIFLGEFFPQPKWERRIVEIAFGLLPTPTIDDANNVKRKSGQYQSLTRTVQTWPTPRTPSGGRNVRSKRDRPNGAGLEETVGEVEPSAVGEKLNPAWVELLMGWPMNWTSLEPLPKEQYLQWANKIKAGHDPWENDDWDDITSRTVKDVDDRTNRLKGIGNGQVSLTAVIAWQLLTEDLVKGKC